MLFSPGIKHFREAKSWLSSNQSFVDVLLVSGSDGDSSSICFARCTAEKIFYNRGVSGLAPSSVAVLGNWLASQPPPRS